MPNATLNDIKIRSLQPPPSGQIDYWDDSLEGFGCRVSQGGSKSFVLKHKNRRITIGRYPIVTLSEARTEAKRMLAEFTLGKIRPRSIAFPQAVNLFLAEKGERRRGRTVSDHKRHLNLLGFTGQLGDISHQDLEPKFKNLPPSEFNHRLACSKTFFNWALKKRYITDNPTVGFSPHPRTRRKRILTDQELAIVWNTTFQMEGDFPEIVRLLILMGQRRGETAALQDHFYSHNAQTVCLPSELTKNHREHTFPVGPMASAILFSRVKQERPSNLLFQAVGSDKPFSGWSKGKKAFDKLLGDKVQPFVLHDLRRTFRSGLGRLKVRPDIAERVVNHLSARTEMEETYDLWTYLPEMREALEKWEAHVQAIIAGPNVEQLRRPVER